MKAWHWGTVLLIGLCARVGAIAVDAPNHVDNYGETLYAPGVLIVNFAAHAQLGTVKQLHGQISTGLMSVDRALEKHGVSKMDKLFPGSTPPARSNRPDLSRFYRIEFPDDVDLNEFMKELALDPNVGSVEPVGVHRIMVIPNDPNFSSQWHHNQPQDHDIDTPDAWNVEPGDSAIIVAIVDTGVNWMHPDLAGPSPYTNGNIWINWVEYNGTPGVDDDGNGYVDDIRGWDWVSVSGAWAGEDGTTPDNDPMDFNGHGTHCSGIAAAITNNGVGVAGVAGGSYPSQRGVRIMPLRVGWSAPDPGSGFETGFVRMDFCAQAFYYAAQNGADVISCSWGSSNSGGIGAALANAAAAGIVVCKAAGNDNNSTADYLCSQTSVISVASTTSADMRSSFSNYGTWVDVSAPGSSIYSTYSNHGSPTYATLSGTSMASPMTAGLAALIKSRLPSLTKSEIETILLNSTDNIDALNPGFEGRLGTGRINALNAMNQMVYGTFNADVRLGTAPLNVHFTGSSPYQVSEWKYHFGDGDSALVQNPIHAYPTPGAYTVSLEVTADQGTGLSTADSFIYVLADTLKPVSFEGPDTLSTVMVPIYLRNVAPIEQMILPLVVSGPLDLVYDSFSTAGTRCAYFESAQLMAYNYIEKKIVFRLRANNGGGSLPLSAGTGTVLKLYFHPSGPVFGYESCFIDSVTYSSFGLKDSTYLGSYVPAFSYAKVTLSGIQRGDANGDSFVNVSDAVYMVNFVFSPGSPAPVTTCGGDANDDQAQNLADAVFLINFVFTPGSPHPASCY